MNSPSMSAVKALRHAQDDKYSATFAADALGLKVGFKGTMATQNPGQILNPFIDEVHAHCMRAGVRQVRVDLTELEFCNSSGFKVFIYWVHRIEELPEAHRYKLRFQLSPTRKWQRTSLLVLTCFAVNLVELEE